MSDDRRESNAVQETESEAPLSLKRRDFLKAGAVAGVGLAVLPRAASASSHERASTCDEPCSMSRPGSTPPGPKDHEYVWDTNQEMLAVQMGILWGYFARGSFDNGVKLVASEVALLGARYEGHVQGPIGPPDWPSRWTQMGTLAADEAKKRSAKCVSAADFQKAWDSVQPGLGPMPMTDRNPVDLSAEVVAGDLWIEFALGAASVSSSVPYGTAVVEEGRRLSRYYIRKNVVRDGVVTRGAPDYTKWKFAEVSTCAYYCGKWAAIDAAGNPISAADFEKAWRDVSTTTGNCGIPATGCG